jgi:hypothetical protein
MNNFSNQMTDNFQNNNSSSNNQLASSSNYLNNNYSNENLINMANNIDTISLSSNDYNGTNLNDISIADNKYEDNSSLIKSLTKEIISNLKENNIDLYDNLTSKKYDESDSDSSSKKKKKKKKNKDKEKYKEEQEENLKEEFQDYILESNPLPSTNSYLSWIFDSCFNFKDFLILFILYFILSQEMIKDFFSKYFTSLNPDDEGKVNIQGVIIYGLILTIFYMLIRKFF